jgi:hypothetical protein
MADSIGIQRADRIKRSLAQSTYITTAWTWFMILAGKAAEPVLVASVLYASVKLLPIVHLPPQVDVVVFIAQFMALDIGGLSLNKLADQAKKDGNEDGARQAKHLSLALVAVMLIGVIMAGVNQIVKLDGQVSTVIEAVLLIARAIMAVLYNRVLHSLRYDEADLYATYKKGQINEIIAEMVKQVIQEALADMQQEIVSHLEANLSQEIDERLTALDAKQAEGRARFKAEQTPAISETSEAIMATLETAVRTSVCETQQAIDRPPSSNVRSITEAASRKQQMGGKGEREIDKRIWPLLNSGMTVRAIAERANTSAATVGRSRKRWESTTSDLVVSQPTKHETTPEMTAEQAPQATP